MSARVSVIPVFVPHLGCPHRCVFCNQRRITGQAEAVTAGTVLSALQQAAGPARNGAARQLAFYGGSFTAIPEEQQIILLSAAFEGIRKGMIDSIRLSTRPDAIDREVLDRLRCYGVRCIELGAQSMDDGVLRLSGRGHRAEDVRQAAQLIRSAGFELILQMMTGLPGDTPEKSMETARELIRLKPDGVRIYPTVIVRDTELYDMWRRGEYREQSVEEAVELCARILPLFEEAGIPVIRLGLNPTEELSSGMAAGGAYHPALGELVKSRVMLQRARELLQGKKPGESAVIGVRSTLLSQAVGQRRQNVELLRREFSLKELKMIPVAGQEEALRLL